VKSHADKPLLLMGMPMVIGSESTRQLLRVVERVAQSSAAALISGESGTGKELLARAIHHYSLRCNNPWVDINCAALPEHLVESELFGYEKGAFSGADSPKPGLFELADKGTLFLDEIGELEAKTQVKLLRVLDGTPYYRVGGLRKISVEVRIVASTNRNLKEMVHAGKFRSDLYHRLSQIHLEVSPLRERAEDIVPLAEFFLQGQDARLRFSPDALDVLKRYSWPGNVRELRNVVIKTAILAENFEIRASDLPAEIRHPSALGGQEPLYSLDALERRMILQVLEQTGGHHEAAAELLGISRRTLSRKLKRYGKLAEVESLVAC
jgi:two-component system, NtrC family, response regulator AtoC